MENWRLPAATTFLIALANHRLALSFSFVIQESQESADHYSKNWYSFHILQGLGALGIIFGSIPIQLFQNVKTVYWVLIYGLTSTLATAFYPTADNFGIFAAAFCRFVNGFGIAAQPFLSDDYVLKWCKKDKENETLAILLAAYPIAATLEGILFFTCEWLHIGWKRAYYIMAIYCFVTTMFYAFLNIPRGKVGPKKESSADLIEHEKAVSLKSLFENHQIALIISVFVGMYYGLAMYAVYTNTMTKAATNLSEDLVVLVGTPFIMLDVLTRIIVGKIADRGKLSLKTIMEVLYILSIIVLTIAIVCGFISQFYQILGVPFLLVLSFLFFGIFQSSLWQLFGRAVQIMSPDLSNTYSNLTVIITGILDCALPLSLLGFESLLAPLGLNQMATYASEFIIFLAITVIAAVVLKMFVTMETVEESGEKISIERL